MRVLSKNRLNVGEKLPCSVIQEEFYHFTVIPPGGKLAIGDCVDGVTCGVRYGGPCHVATAAICVTTVIVAVAVTIFISQRTQRKNTKGKKGDVLKTPCPS